MQTSSKSWIHDQEIVPHICFMATAVAGSGFVVATWRMMEPFAG